MSEYVTLDRWVALLQSLAQGGHKLLSFQALRHMMGLHEATTRKALRRLEKKGFVLRLGRQLYANGLARPQLEEVAMVLGRPTYVSFESALAQAGVLSQMPLTLTCASTTRSGLRSTPLGDITFHHLRVDLFFGYHLQDGVAWADAEKALLDWIYLSLKTQGNAPPLDELDSEPLDRERLEEWAAHYPRSVVRVVSSDVLTNLAKASIL
jgi:predicted transcriptional regulator of viral defense system